MATITLEIPDDKLTDLEDTMAELKAIPEDDDPDNPGQKIPRYTKREWLGHLVTVYLRDQMARRKQQAARDAITFAQFQDDDLAAATVTHGGVSTGPVVPRVRPRPQ
jgi:hypothetical protein